MSDLNASQPGDEESVSLRDQLEHAVRDLWSMVSDVGEDYVVFMDRRRLETRVERQADGLFHVQWETDSGEWVSYERAFENPREAAFHGFQGPH